MEIFKFIGSFMDFEKFTTNIHENMEKNSLNLNKIKTIIDLVI